MMGKTPTFAFVIGLALAGAPAITLASPASTKLAQPLSGQGGISRALNAGDATTASGKALVSVRLSADFATSDIASIEAEQQAFIARALQLPGTRVVGRVRIVLNAVFLEMDPSQVANLNNDGAVTRVTPVGNYRLDLSETVPYIGAAAVQTAGIDGTGVSVAVLDSGIDYLHADLGGSGSVTEYEANDVNIVEPGTFPTTKVVGGFDFVGEVWPEGDLQPDADPLDFEGHGTHVADIIGGVNGVAPGVDLYAVKVCSAISSSCSGVALLQGVEFSVDPNGDGNTSDHVDIMNMSLGSVYGQPFDDDLVAATEAATKIGVLTVASAGNSGDNPYSTGTPAAASTALSVAQTAVPSAVQDQMEITAPASAAGLYVAVRQPWSGELTSAISGPVQYADGAAGNLDGCAAFAPNSLTGQIVVVDRGGCFFSDKIRNIEDAGGILGIIALITPEEPFAGGFGGGTPITIPGFMITQADGDVLRTGAASISFDPVNGIPLSGSIVASSSRGPRNGDNALKPEIGAPGASVSAIAGSGTDTGPFGGTSGAAPMVAGSAALLKEARPWAQPWLLKTLLMNSANPDIILSVLTSPPSITEVSRIGAGEVNVNAAFNSKIIVDPGGDSAALSFGYRAVSRTREVVRRRIAVTNQNIRSRTFNIASSFRFENDAMSNAIEIRHPSRIRVGPQQTKEFTVTFKINGENLPLSQMSSGAAGNNQASLTATEFDGYITVSDSSDEAVVPWHMIPRKSADVRAPSTFRMKNGSASVNVRNVGVGPANNDAFTLVAVSEDIPAGAPGTQAPTPDIKAVGVRTSTVPAGFCSGNPSFLLEFAFHSWEPQTNVLPVLFAALIDVDGDGTDDFEALNGDLGAVLSDAAIDGRSVAIANDLSTGDLTAFFFTEHATNTKNTIITFCAEQFGFTVADLGTRDITVTFSANDFYFGGPDDELPPVTFTLGGGFSASIDDIDAKSSGTMTITNNGGTGGDLGILLFTNGDRGAANRGGATPATEGRILTPPGTKLPF